MCRHVKSSHRQEIGTAGNMEYGRGQLQIHHSSIRDSTKISESGADEGRGCLFFLLAEKIHLNPFLIYILLHSSLVSLIVKIIIIAINKNDTLWHATSHNGAFYHMCRTKILSLSFIFLNTIS